MSRQSSGKSASRQRSYERSSSDVKERCSREPRAERVQERHAMFQRESRAESVTPCFRESQEPRASRHVSERVKSRERHAMFQRESRAESVTPCFRERFATGALFFNSPTCSSPRAACRIRWFVWGGAPPMSRLAGWTNSSVMSHHFWEG